MHIKVSHLLTPKILFSILFVLVSSQVIKAQQEIKIIYFSNMPEVSESNGRPGLARVSAYINESRDKDDNQFVIHGGDSLSPAVLSSLDRGAHMIDILNTVEPDVFSIAKREFAYGEDMLIQRAEEALFPFVSSNIADKRTGEPFESISQGEIFFVSDLSIGVVALTSPAVIKDYAIHRTVMLDAVDSARKQADILRNQGADIIILTTDFDVKNYANLFSSHSIDLVIEAGFEGFFSEKVGDTYYVRLLEDGRNISDITLSLDQEVSDQGDDQIRITGVEIINPDLTQYAPDDAVESAISLHLAPLEELLNTPIGTIKGKVSTSRNSLRSGENAFANMLADSLRQKVNADVALINGGSIRGDRDYPDGYNLTRRDMQAELPFRNTIALLEVSGKQIWDAIEYAIPCRIDFDGCFPQVSNIEARYSVSENKLTSLLIGGVPIDISKLYTLATTDYLSGGGDGYAMLAAAKKLETPERGQLTREILSQYIIDSKIIEPRLQNRIIIEP
jgi:2',3'-cyclic-nucleotide 2'-phosphodiesterase (5'-nucleotidase family)